MSLLNPANPDIAFARDCVIHTLADIPDSVGADVIVHDEQAYLAAMVQRNHERQRDAAIQAAAERLARKARKQARHTPRIVDFQIRKAS